MMKHRGQLVLLLSLLVIGGGVAGCGIQSHTGTQQAASSVKAPADYMTGVKEQSLAADDVTAVQTSSLPDGVAATKGVHFTGESGTNMMLLQFKTSDDTQAAWKIYIDRGQRVHSDGNLLLVSDHSLNKDWFKKYQDAIFKQ